MQSETTEKSLPSTVESAVKIYVKDLQDKQSFHSLFLAKEKALLTGKNGKSYLSLFLADSSGSVDARVWDNVESINATFQSGDIVRVKGQVQIYQNRKQVVIHRLEKATDEQFTMTDFINAAERVPEEMLAELVSIAQSIENGNIRQLTLDVLNDPEIRDLLLLAPAAKTIHHAYLGGLLEHILSICGWMKFLVPHYRAQNVELNMDYLIFGAIFHDIGKIWELDIANGVSYSDRGKLLGHLIMAVELIEKKASRILGFSEELKTKLKHIVLSHHGKLEYGSPKTPMFLEAVLVAAIDDLDSKINTISGFIKAEQETGESWSKYNQLFERYFLLRP